MQKLDPAILRNALDSMNQRRGDHLEKMRREFEKRITLNHQGHTGDIVARDISSFASLVSEDFPTEPNATLAVGLK